GARGAEDGPGRLREGDPARPGQRGCLQRPRLYPGQTWRDSPRRHGCRQGPALRAADATSAVERGPDLRAGWAFRCRFSELESLARSDARGLPGPSAALAPSGPRPDVSRAAGLVLARLHSAGQCAEPDPAQPRVRATSDRVFPGGEVTVPEVAHDQLAGCT